jgi:HD-like signal output (HDOD) protein
MDLHLRGKLPRKSAAQKALSPSAVKDRVMADLETMTDLPQLPQVFEKISHLARNPDSDLKEWIAVIEVEPMTCAMILRQANSSSMGMQVEITAVDRAIVMLGKNTVSGLVASEAVRKSFTAVEDIGFKLEEFWLHNLAVGYSAHLLSLAVATEGEQTQGETIATAGLDDEAIAVLRAINLPERLELPPDSPCFIAGTMHDIGKGVMVHSYPGLFPMLLEELREKEWKVPMLSAERTVAGGLTHPVAGEVLMRNWGLADRLGNVVLSHHSPDPDDRLTFLVSIADVVGQVLFPFPAGAAYPLAKAVEDGSLTDVMAFLPTGFLDQSLLSTDELMRLINAIRARVRRFVDETRHSVM